MTTFLKTSSKETRTCTPHSSRERHGSSHSSSRHSQPWYWRSPRRPAPLPSQTRTSRPPVGPRSSWSSTSPGRSKTTAGAETAVRNAANAFAGGLADTGSQLAVIEFGSSAKRVFNYTHVTSGAGGTLTTTFQPYFNGTAARPADVYNSPSQTGQWTNWQDALEEVKLLNTASGVAPLVVFITDGDPTATGPPRRSRRTSRTPPRSPRRSCRPTRSRHRAATSWPSASAPRSTTPRASLASARSAARTR